MKLIHAALLLRCGTKPLYKRSGLRSSGILGVVYNGVTFPRWCSTACPSVFEMALISLICFLVCFSGSIVLSIVLMYFDVQLRERTRANEVLVYNYVWERRVAA